MRSVRVVALCSISVAIGCASRTPEPQMPARELTPPARAVALPLGLENHAVTRAGRTVVARTRVIFASLNESQYQHNTEIDEEEGIYNWDCSGFVRHILTSADARLLDPFPRDPGMRGPRAWNFYTFFASLAPGEIRSGWQGIALSRVRPGDIIAWRKPVLPLKGTTGHVVIVMGDALVDERGGRKGVMIRVADSSGGGLENDTRQAGQTGLGVGDMFFELDELGRPLTVRSGHSFRKMPIAAGRPIGRRDSYALTMPAPASESVSQ